MKQTAVTQYTVNIEPDMTRVMRGRRTVDGTKHSDRKDEV